jgi:Ca-activated chloride channel family protein
MTGGSYHLAESADQLKDVFQNLPTQLMTVTETTEVSVLFVVIGALLATIAIALSIIWHPLP